MRDRRQKQKEKSKIIYEKLMQKKRTFTRYEKNSGKKYKKIGK